MARPIAPGSGAFIALIAAMMTMTAMTIDINLPAIPATASDLGASLTTSQLTVTIFFGGFAVGQLVWGPLSDRIGRKPGVLIGTVIYVLATVGCALSPDMTTLLVCRAVQGFGAGAGSVLGRAIIRDLFEGPQMARMLSLALAAFITAPIVAPTIGAAILSVASWRWVYGFLAIYGLVMLALAALFLEESLKNRDTGALGPAQLWRGFAAVFRDPASRPWAIVVILGFGTLTIYLTNSSAVLMQGYGMSASQFGAAFAIVAVCSFAGNILNSRLVQSPAAGAPDPAGAAGCHGHGRLVPGHRGERLRRGLDPRRSDGPVLHRLRPACRQWDHAGASAACGCSGCRRRGVGLRSDRHPGADGRAGGAPLRRHRPADAGGDAAPGGPRLDRHPLACPGLGWDRALRCAECRNEARAPAFSVQVMVLSQVTEGCRHADR